MTSSTSSSGSVRVRIVLTAVAAASPGARGAPRRGLGGRPGAPARRPRSWCSRRRTWPRPRLPSREVTSRLEQMVAMAGADVIGGDRLDEYLARYRIRYTGGVDPVAAKAAREDLGADAILATSVMLWSGVPPQVALVSRLVSTADTPAVLWMDGFARTGDDSPGLLGLNVIADPQVLQDEALQRLGVSLEAYLATRSARRDVLGRGLVASPRRLPGPTRRATRGERGGPSLRERDPPPRAPARSWPSSSPGRSRTPTASAWSSRGSCATSCCGAASSWRTASRSTRRAWSSATLDADLVVAGYVFDFEEGGTPHSNFTVHGHRPQDGPGGLGIDLLQQGHRLGDPLRPPQGEHRAAPHLPDGARGDRRR